MKMSEQGYTALMGLESFSDEIYQDIGAGPTIGYGHRVRPQDRVDIHTRWSPEHAQGVLRADVEAIDARLATLLHAQLTQPQYDALVCFAYDAGINAFSGSTLLARINAGEEGWDVPAELGRWVFLHINGEVRESPGLHRRREAEFKMWHGEYPGIEVVNAKEEQHATTSSERDGGQTQRQTLTTRAGAQGAGSSGAGDRVAAAARKPG